MFPEIFSVSRMRSPTFKPFPNGGETVVSMSPGFAPILEPRSSRASRTGLKIAPPTDRGASNGSSSPNEARRVSVSPLPFTTQNEERRFEGPDRKKLHDCLVSLTTTKPSISEDEGSVFGGNIKTVGKFLCNAVNSEGAFGLQPGQPAALYICGAPGLGKTTGVRWCCENVSKSLEGSAHQPMICHITANFLASQSNPLEIILSEIASIIRLKARHPSEATMKKILTKGNASYPWTLVLVVDEIDALCSSRGKLSSKGDALQTLLSWANDPFLRMCVIGISNCVNNASTDRLFEPGLVCCSGITHLANCHLMLSLLTLCSSRLSVSA